MLPDKIIEEVPVTRVGNRYAVSVRIPWYRTLPLSSLTALRLVLDGEPAEEGSLTWTVNGNTYSPEELVARYQEWWNVLDSAILEGAFTLEHGPSAAVHVQIGLVIPYLVAGDGYLQIEEKDDKELAVEGAAA